PFLTKCEADECRRQIADNKAWIEQISKRPCEALAYPSGEYDREVLEQCRLSGLRYGHAIIPKYKAGSHLEIPRIGIYSTSMDILGFKVQWGNLLRELKVKVG